MKGSREENAGQHNISNISGIIVQSESYQDSFTEPRFSPVNGNIDFRYNYQGALLEKNDSEDIPEITRPVLP